MLKLAVLHAETPAVSLAIKAIILSKSRIIATSSMLE